MGLNAGTVTTTTYDNRGNPIVSEVPVLTHVDALASDPDYNVLLKRYDVNQEHLRKLQTSILEVEDRGFSWDKLLRFKGITFSSGGTFKLCFCDSTLLGGSTACRSEADYSVEVGTIHASGVSCLIAKPELQRVSCVPQFGPAPASLRCYKQYASPPNDAAPDRADHGRDVQDDDEGRWCRRCERVHEVRDDERGGGEGGPGLPGELGAVRLWSFPRAGVLRSDPPTARHTRCLRRSAGSAL